MLTPHNSNEPVWYGCRLKGFVPEGYMSSDAGYVLSREAVRRLVEGALPNGNKCRQRHVGNEEVEIGRCLASVGVRGGDSRDFLGRYRFMPLKPERHLVPGSVKKSFLYWKAIYYPTERDMGCCSDHTVTFYGITPNEMYVLEYLIYHMTPYGINTKFVLEREKIAVNSSELQENSMLTSTISVA